MAVENPDMRQLLAAQTEWHRAVAFDSQGVIIGATCQPSAAEITCVRVGSDSISRPVHLLLLATTMSLIVDAIINTYTSVCFQLQ